MHHEPDIEGEVTFLPTSHGGRQGFVATGYRAQFYWAGQDWDAPQYFVGREKVEPGETVTSSFYFLSPDLVFGKLAVGDPFLIREGNRTVAYGKVTRLLNLETHSREVARERRP